MERVSKALLQQSSKASGTRTPSLPPDFSQRLALLDQTLNFYSKEMDEQEKLLWLEPLSKYPADDIRKALKAWMANPESSTFFPKPGEVIATIREMKPPVSTRIDYTKTPACAECNDLKYVYVPHGQSNVTAVRPCPGCRKVSA